MVAIRLIQSPAYLPQLPFESTLPIAHHGQRLWPCHGSSRMRLIQPRASPHIIVHGDGTISIAMSHYTSSCMVFITTSCAYDQTLSASCVPFQGNSTSGFIPRAWKVSVRRGFVKINKMHFYISSIILRCFPATSPKLSRLRLWV